MPSANVGFAIGLGANSGSAIATDGAGNSYVGGTFGDPFGVTADFAPGVPGGELTAAPGISHVYVAKYSPTGGLLWVRDAYGTTIGAGHSVGDIALDASGNVLVAGSFQVDIDFDPAAPGGELVTTNGNGVEAQTFVVKLDGNGVLQWTKGLIGALGGSAGYGIAADASGNVYTAGTFAGDVDFDPDPNATHLVTSRSPASTTPLDIFVSKLDSNGNFDSVGRLGFDGNDVARGLAVDGAGNVYLAGAMYYLTQFTTGTLLNVFVCKLDPQFNTLWQQHVSGDRLEDVALDIGLDTAGNVYTAGLFRNTLDLDDSGPGPAFATAGGDDIFVWKLTGQGAHVWGRQIGNASDDRFTHLAVDGPGNVYLTGDFGGTVDFNPAAPGGELTATSRDIFALKLSNQGNYSWALRAGGAKFDRGLGVAVNASGTVLTSGFFEAAADFEVGRGVTSLTAGPSQGAFVWQVAGPLEYTATAGNGADDLTLRRNGDYLELVDNLTNTVVAGRRLATTTGVVVTGANNEADTLTLDFGFGGSFSVPNGVNFDGGTGSGTNRLVIQGARFLNETYTPGADPTSGTVRLSQSPLVGTGMPVTYNRLQRIDSLSASGGPLALATRAYVNGTSGQDAISVVNGPTVNGLATTQVGGNTFTTVNFANQDYVTVYGLGGADTVSLNNPTPGASLNGLTIDGGTETDGVTVVTSAHVTAGAVPVTVRGGGGTGDWLTGPGTGPVWNVTGPDAGNINNTLTFSQVETLYGGIGADRFQFHGSPATAYLTGKIYSGSGKDTLDYSLYTGPGAAPVTVNLQARTATAMAGFDHMEVLTGGAGGDTLIGADLATNRWDVTGKNAGKVGGFTFTEVENLTGGAKADQFVFAATGPTQAYVTGVVNGGSGTDRLDYSLYPGAISVTVNLQTRAAPGTGGFQDLEAVTGGQSKADTLIGADAENTWDVTDTYLGTVNGGFEFRAVENLTGGTGADRFVFGKSLQSRAANIDGGAGADTLDYALYPQGVGVNLFTRAASGVMLPTNLPGQVTGVENVTGSPFIDSLTGDDLGNVLLGLGGDDLIRGRGGNDLLVGGDGKDTVEGDGGEDILIGGIYGNELDPAGLGVMARAVMNVWSTPDPFMARVASLRTNATGVALTIAQVADDGDVDTLRGGNQDRDWFLHHGDMLADWVGGIDERN